MDPAVKRCIDSHQHWWCLYSKQGWQPVDSPGVIAAAEEAERLQESLSPEQDETVERFFQGDQQ